MADDDFLYDLDRLIELRELARQVGDTAAPSTRLLSAGEPLTGRVGVLSGSFNPLTHAHEVLVSAALELGIASVLLLIPCRAVDKESVTRAALYDRILVALQWASSRQHVSVGLTNCGLYVDQATQLISLLPQSKPTFLVGFDKIVQ